jgi:hypothetical protein
LRKIGENGKQKQEIRESHFNFSERSDKRDKHMKSNANRRYIKIAIIVSVIIYFIGFVLIPKAIAQGTLDLVLFYRVRFEALGQSPKGHHYTNLFDVYTREITEIIMSDSSLTWKSIDVLIKWQPNLDALVNGRGGDVIISEDAVSSVENYLVLIAQHASPELKSVIDEELLATPLEDMAGMTMNEAWAYLNEDPRFQDQILELHKLPTLKPDSPGTLSGSFSENSKYEIDFDEETWVLSSWNNGVADSWIAENLDMSDCTLTNPRSVSNPYDNMDISYKTLGNVKYKVETDNLPIKRKVMTLYILYQPIEMAGQQLQEDRPPFILYPGISNTAQCIEQSESALASLHFVPDSDLQGIQ